jgi:hypothetical protein
MNVLVWSFAKQRVQARKPTTVQQLKDVRTEESVSIPLEMCQKLCMSVFQKCECVSAMVVTSVNRTVNQGHSTAFSCINSLTNPGKKPLAMITHNPT